MTGAGQEHNGGCSTGSPFVATAGGGSLGEFYDQELRPRLTAEAVYTHPAHCWHKSGDRWRGGCPWHPSESGTSFVVTPGSLMWWCAGCCFGGGPVQYLHRLAGGDGRPRGRDFVDIVRKLAGLAGVPFPERELTEEERERARWRDVRRAILQSAIAHCQEVLRGERGEAARAYLGGRGFTDEDVADLGIGLYPKPGELRSVLQRHGYAERDVDGAGVIFAKLWGYVVFPWLDECGAPLSLYGEWPGRPVPAGKPKKMALRNPGRRGREYEATKRSPLYLDRALRAGHRDLVLVEGLTDAALLQRRGDTRVVSPVANKLSKEQAQTLARRGVRSVTICLDPDMGGKAGTPSCVRMLLAAGISPYVSDWLPDGLDPDEFVLARGIDAWKEHVAEAGHGYRHLARLILEKYRPPRGWTDRAVDAALAEARQEAAGAPADCQALDLHFWDEVAKGLGVPADQLVSRAPGETRRNGSPMPDREPAGGGGDDGAGAGESSSGTDAGLPTIQGNKRQLRDVTAQAHEAILARNEPPTIFQRGGLLTRLRVRADGGAPYLEPLCDAALRGVLARFADWTKVSDTKHGQVVEEDAPPVEVVKDLANLPDWDGIPLIDAVVECPVFTPGGLVITPGFHRAARLWYQPASDLKIPDVPDRPTAAEVKLATDLLLIELLGDFPLVDAASKAHVLAALLLPFVRPLVDGPTPMHLLDAPVEGTGKTLLASVIGLVSTGREPEAMAEGSCDEEWRKRLTALLAEGPTFVLLDNLNRVLDSAALAAALTCRVWKDRVLGVSKTATLPNTAVWLASGNNTRMSRELIRRTVWSRLDAKVDAPWERSVFRHPNLIGWAKANRGALVGAALTLCQAWVAEGKPPGKQVLGMFESWAETIGGILDVAGVPGLLANAKEFRADRADKVSEWRAFVAAWWHEHASEKVGVDQLFALAVRDKLLDSVLGDKGERSQRIRLGQAMVKAADRVYGDYRVERAGDDHKGRQQYRLQQVAAKPAETKPDEASATSAATPSTPPGAEDVQEWSA
jgi:DNA primase